MNGWRHRSSSTRRTSASAVRSLTCIHIRCRWGCTLSNKLFVGKEYVLKHIRSKHPERFAEERDRVLDEVYWDNFKAFRQREQDEAPKDAPVVLDQLPVLPMLPGGLPGALPGPILGGAMPGQVLVPAPGAGPLGPFVLAPVGGKVPGPAPPRGPPPGRGRGRGRGPGRGRGREYHDLDAPYNNRAVLDYSDL